MSVYIPYIEREYSSFARLSTAQMVAPFVTIQQWCHLLYVKQSGYKECCVCWCVCLFTH